MISIIIPTYNAEAYLKECLESVRKQNYSDFEVLCINDGSTDRSPSICEEYVKKDARFHLVNQENGGVSKARNAALDLVKGDYVCFVDSDDVIAVDHLSNFISLIEDYDIAVTDYTRDVAKLGDKATMAYSYESTLFIKNIIDEKIKHPQIVCMLFRTNIVKDNNLSFTVGCVRNEDAEFYIKYLANAKKVHTSDFKGYYYRENEESAVHKFNKDSLTFIEADSRISKYLVERGIYPSMNYIMSSSIQFFTYRCARQGNEAIYNLVHEKYDVRNEMNKMLRFPRIARKLVALIYLFLGRNLFYKLMKLL